MIVKEKIKEANFENIEAFASIAILGKRRTGKTTWAKYILQFLKKKCNRYFVVCGNKDNQVEWSKVVSPLFIFDKEKSMVALERIRLYQEVKCSEYHDIDETIPVEDVLCVIFDDCGSDRKFMHSNLMKDLLSNGRHYGMFIIILSQYLNQMHAVNRDQLDYLGVLYTNNQKNITKIYEEYVNVCDRRTFNWVLLSLTTKRGMCWIDNTKTPTLVSDCVFHKKIPLPLNFVSVESRAVRDFAKLRYMSKEKQLQINDHRKTRDRVLKIDSGSDDEHLRNDRNEYTDHKGTLVVYKL